MYKMGTYVIFVVDRRYRRLRCPLVCTEVQTINRSERTAKQTVAIVECCGDGNCVWMR